jgi:hypothetical protein
MYSRSTTIAITFLFVAFSSLALATAVTTPVAAQDFDPSDCEQSCDAAHEACIESCDEHENPVECDSACDDSLDDCLEACD